MKNAWKRNARISSATRSAAPITKSHSMSCRVPLCLRGGSSSGAGGGASAVSWVTLDILSRALRRTRIAVEDALRGRGTRVTQCRRVDDLGIRPEPQQQAIEPGRLAHGEHDVEAAVGSLGDRSR